MFKKFIEKKHWCDLELITFILIFLTLVIRLSIYYSTTLFSFSDYGVYLSTIETIHSGDKVFLQNGNFFFAISYIGYYTEYILGSLDYFFIFNCLAGTLTSLVIFYVLKSAFHSSLAGFIACVFYIFYTEYMTFSSVFYTPILMILLLSLFVFLLSFYYRFAKILPVIMSTVGLVIIFLLTFFFKPELLYFPIFLIVFSLFFIRKNKIFMLRSLALAFILMFSYFIFNSLNIITRPDKNVVSNSFIFFGHTNYGGDGGEGAFVYPENEVRYNKALADWCEKYKILKPDANDINRFQSDEIIKFAAGSPFAWIKLQLTKFFRTFGIVPETVSFKVLYTGLLKNNLWLTSAVVVAPVAIIILLLIIFFNLSSIKKLFNTSTLQHFNSVSPSTQRNPHAGNNNHFFYIYLLLFFYYIIATVFYGQYQERYRMPVMVVFVIPMLSYFIVSFEKEQFFNRIALWIKGVVIVLFMTIWIFQAKKAISNKIRFDNAIESVKGIIE